MNERRIDVFFYGLFMDEAILHKNGLKPAMLRKAYLEDYTLKIGNRASLIPAKGKKAYGLVIKVDETATLKLYTESSVADYVPEAVKVVTTTGVQVNATCYNLPLAHITGTNTAYAQALYVLARSLDFPEDYLEHIKLLT